LEDIYYELKAGNRVVVDILAHDGASFHREGDPQSSYAHFARVLGVDLQKGEIYLQDSVTPTGATYWTLSEEQYNYAANNPEKLAKLGPDPSERQEIKNWIMIIDVKD